MPYVDENQHNGVDNVMPKINDVSQKFLQDLEKERDRLPKDFPICALLIKEGMC